ncbi:hypothetical protein K4F52_001438 [Lecanicillium sp. MT-2017a]|nr:hypothetical protein K4F52_001438 [Lecanicillium sp. MT-2017a]
MASKYLDSPHCLLSDSPPSREPGTVLLETERLILRRPLASDAPTLAAIGSYAEVAQNMSDRFRYPYTVEDAESYLAMVLPKQDGDDDPKSYYPKACLFFLKPNSPDNPTPEPVMIGSMGCSTGEDIHHIQWTLGYFLTPSAWGKGYATEAIGGFVHWAFATWPKLHRIEAETFSTNMASAKMLRRIGFTQEGIRRGCMIKKGVIQDALVFGRLRTDKQR